MEVGIKDGRQHGYELRWHNNGVLLSALPYRNGLEHGIARQWSADGELKLTYEMRKGTGIDLWGVPLSEERHFEQGILNGFERWWDGNDRTVFEERHWRADQWHGIQRSWNDQGRLRRGFPKYFVAGNKVTKRQYLAACKNDPSLPPYRKKDDKPTRPLPIEYTKQMKEKWGTHWRRNRRRFI